MLSTIIDPFFSSLILLLALVLALMALGGYLAFMRKPPFANEKANIAYRTTVFVLLFAFLVAMRVGCATRYGYSNETPAMCVTGGTLCLLDKKENCDADGAMCTDEFRLHLVDPATGARVHREYVGSKVKLVASGDGLVLFERGGAFPVYDVARKKIARVIDADYLAKKYDGLRGGVAAISSYSGPNTHESDAWLKIEAKDGSVFHLDAFTGTLVGHRPPAVSGNGCYIDKSHTCLDLPGGRVNLALQSSGRSYKIKELRMPAADGRTTAAPDGRTYLEGEFVTRLPGGSGVLIRSYETTDHENFILTAVGPDLGVKWALEQKKIGGYDWFSRKPRLQSAIAVGGRIVFNSGGIIFCADAATGKILWKSRI